MKMSREMKFQFFARGRSLRYKKLKDAMEDFEVEWGRSAILQAFPNYGPKPEDIETEKQAEFVAMNMMDGGSFVKIDESQGRRTKMDEQKTFHIEVVAVKVLTRNGTDLIHLETELPPCFPAGVGANSPTLQFETQKGCGADYVRENFGVEPEIIET